MSNWRSGWRATGIDGVFVQGDRARVRVRVLDPRSGRLREIHRIIKVEGAFDAEAAREKARRALETELAEPPEPKVCEFQRQWLHSKKDALDPGTYDRYVDGLEKHFGRELGNMQVGDVRTRHVQEWVNGELKKGYSVLTVRGWFRAARSMFQDAVEDLMLNRDPTRRIHFPLAEPRYERNALLPEELRRFLAEMRVQFPQHYALAATLTYTGLRFCHASALRWEDWDDDLGILHIRRRQIRGRIGPVTLVKRAPREYPVPPDLRAALTAQRGRLSQKKGRPSAWMFPTRRGTLRCTSSLRKAWQTCLAAAGVADRFTVHGLRRTFVDLARLAKVDGVVTRSLTGHVSEKMRFHYSTVALDEKRQAVMAVAALVGASPAQPAPQVVSEVVMPSEIARCA